MGTEEAELHYELDGKIVIYKRAESNTSNYYARIKLPHTGKWKKFSTKTNDLTKAIEFAKRQNDLIEIKLENGYVLDSRYFRNVAKEAIKEMQAELDGGRGKVSYKDYITFLENHLIPHLGKKYISSITHKDLNKFLEERREDTGKKQLSRSTINNYGAALSKVYEIAVRNHWIDKSQVVRFVNKGKKTERRPYFTIEELRVLRAHLKKQAHGNLTSDFPKGGVTNKSLSIRHFLYHFVDFILFTGIRPGTETKGLKWKHIELKHHKKDKERYFYITVPRGKTGRRTVVAMHGVQRCLQDLLTTYSDSKDIHYDFSEDLSDIDDYIFRLPCGTDPKDLYGAFRKALKDSGLLYDREGNKRSLYSLRHSHATMQLEEGIPLHTLAKNMGTSVEMIERHYSHLQVWNKAQQLAREAYQEYKFKYEKDERLEKFGKKREERQST